MSANKAEKDRGEIPSNIPEGLPETDFPLDPVQQKAFDIIEKSDENVFLQGRAGTGKTTFIQYLRRHSRKKIRIVCPTATAAVNLGAATIHSLFLLPLSDFFVFEDILPQPRKKLQSVLTRTDMLVIDEVSMVRPDMLDIIDLLCRQARSNHFQPFGGLQILLVGDMMQLPPVIKQSAYEVFEQKYGRSQPYFFHSNVYAEAGFRKIELSEVYRQSDTDLLENLGYLRSGERLSEAADYFNSCGSPTDEFVRTAVTLTPYRRVADSMNSRRLAEINTPSMTYKCSAEGSFEKSTDSPAPRELELKPGAMVIFCRNNPGVWINGTSGIVRGLSDDRIDVEIISSGKIVPVGREEWKSYKYEFKRMTGRVEEIETGSFRQFPLQLGYALTIHRAQGKTLDKAVIEMRHGTFAHGQLYVALSRTRRKSDMRIMGRICEEDMITDPAITDFLKG